MWRFVNENPLGYKNSSHPPSETVRYWTCPNASRKVAAALISRKVHEALLKLTIWISPYTRNHLKPLIILTKNITIFVSAWRSGDFWKRSYRGELDAACIVAVCRRVKINILYRLARAEILSQLTKSIKTEIVQSKPSVLTRPVADLCHRILIKLIY